MFKVGDFVSLIQSPLDVFVVTRVYNENYMAVGTFNELDGWIEDEYKVKKKYFKLLGLDDYNIPGMTFRIMLEGFIESGYFTKNEDGSIILNYTESSRKGSSPEFGLPIWLGYIINAIE